MKRIKSKLNNRKTRGLLFNSSFCYLFLFSLILLAFSCQNKSKKSQQIQAEDINYEKVRTTAQEESLLSIRPGLPGGQAFWNTHARQFTYAPSFQFEKVEKATKYKFVAIDADSITHDFISDTPWASLAPIWEKLSVGFVSLSAEGLDESNKTLGLSGSRVFYKASVFKGPYHQKKMTYKESARKALDHLFAQEHIQAWAIDGEPDTLAYQLYCYPSKVISAISEGMLVYREAAPENAEKALEIAINAANYLMKISEPANALLAHFPPTYQGSARTAKPYQGQFMTIYPAKTALIYLDLFDVTQDARFKDEAIRIAETFVKLQLPSGTWKLKLWKDGTPVNENDCIPLDMVKLFDRLKAQYGINDYNEVRDRAYQWIWENPVKTFNWSGQFEDILPVKPYQNLSKDEASAFAIYILEQAGEHPEYIDIAKELLRFCEDQFIIWEKPMPQKQYNVSEWITPCVLEQYNCYEPINASASNMIEAFLVAYQVTQEEIYLAKAVELANTMTVAQLPENGRYPTYWQLNDRQEEGSGWIDWLNCTTFSVKTMLKMAAFVESTH